MTAEFADESLGLLAGLVCRDPVKTNDFPAKVSAVGAYVPSGWAPARLREFGEHFRGFELAKKAATDSAVVRPIPWTASSSSAEAACDARLPKRRERIWAACSPTRRMPSAKIRRGSGGWVLPATAARMLSAGLSPMRSSGNSCALVRSTGPRRPGPAPAPSSAGRACPRAAGCPWAAGDEMVDAFGHLGRAAAPVRAARDGFAVGPNQRRPARRAVGGAVCTAPCLRPLRRDYLDDFGDYLAGVLNDDGVADPDVLAVDLLLVVQGGALDDGVGRQRYRCDKGRG